MILGEKKNTRVLFYDFWNIYVGINNLCAHTVKGLNNECNTTVLAIKLNFFPLRLSYVFIFNTVSNTGKDDKFTYALIDTRVTVLTASSLQRIVPSSEP